MSNQVTMEVPIALQNLIKANNALLKSYQSRLMEEVQQANIQLMQILQIDPRNGWRLDMDNMVYVRIDQSEPTAVTDPDGFAVGDEGQK
jgi:hypothetical protein